MLEKFRFWLITIIAGDMPVIHGWNINWTLVKSGSSAVYIPNKGDKYKESDLIQKAVLTPVRNVA